MKQKGPVTVEEGADGLDTIFQESIEVRGSSYGLVDPLETFQEEQVGLTLPFDLPQPFLRLGSGDRVAEEGNRGFQCGPGSWSEPFMGVRGHIDTSDDLSFTLDGYDGETFEVFRFQGFPVVGIAPGSVAGWAGRRR